MKLVCVPAYRMQNIIILSDELAIEHISQLTTVVSMSRNQANKRLHLSTELIVVGSIE